MKVARYSFEGRHGFGIVSGSGLVPAGTNALAPVPEGDPIALSALELLPPVGRDAKIVCVGLNYADHAVEGGVDLPEEPLIFAKLPSSLIGPGRPINPKGSDRHRMHSPARMRELITDDGRDGHLVPGLAPGPPRPRPGPFASVTFDFSHPSNLSVTHPVSR